MFFEKYKPRGFISKFHGMSRWDVGRVPLFRLYRQREVHTSGCGGGGGGGWGEEWDQYPTLYDFIFNFICHSYILCINTPKTWLEKKWQTCERLTGHIKWPGRTPSWHFPGRPSYSAQLSSEQIVIHQDNNCIVLRRQCDYKQKQKLR